MVVAAPPKAADLERKICQLLEVPYDCRGAIARRCALVE